MALTKSELIDSLQNEVRILNHLATKVDRSKLDYRPTPKQRSTLEWLQYLTIMGPELVRGIKALNFDGEAWMKAEEAAKARDFDQTVAELAKLGDVYASLASLSDEDFRAEFEMFGSKYTRASAIVNVIICGHAAYRTQLFNHLKASGREELNTMNLWAGMDAPMPSA
jgi:hypothetical protein